MKEQEQIKEFLSIEASELEQFREQMDYEALIKARGYVACVSPLLYIAYHEHRPFALTVRRQSNFFSLFTAICSTLPSMALR